MWGHAKIINSQGKKSISTQEHKNPATSGHTRTYTHTHKHTKRKGKCQGDS
jgi:hypothetical protein